MLKENYKSWGIDINDFFDKKTEKEKLTFLLNFAVLAPSSHNSQPWAFSVEKNSILVYAEPKRRLKVGDKDSRFLFISLGCAIANIVIAADYYGLSTKITYTPDSSDELAAILSFGKIQKEVDKNDKHLVFAICHRSVNREKYEPKLPPQSFLEEVGILGNSQLSIDIISGQSIKEKLADIVVDSAVEVMEDSNFRVELSHYVKTNITKSKVGIPAFGMGIPTLISLIVPALVKYFNMDKVSQNSFRNLLKNFTPIFVVLSTKTDKKTDWIKVGETYQKIALLAEQKNIKTAIWGAPTITEKYSKKIQNVLGNHFRPQIFFRMGYSKKNQPHSPRLSVSEVLKN